jgi:hypothetical protein
MIALSCIAKRIPGEAIRVAAAANRRIAAEDTLLFALAIVMPSCWRIASAPAMAAAISPPGESMTTVNGSPTGQPREAARTRAAVWPAGRLADHRPERLADARAVLAAKFHDRPAKGSQLGDKLALGGVELEKRAVGAVSVGARGDHFADLRSGLGDLRFQRRKLGLRLLQFLRLAHTAGDLSRGLRVGPVKHRGLSPQHRGGLTPAGEGSGSHA